MSQLDRQKAYAKALAHRDELVKRIHACDMSVECKGQLIDLLTVLWLQADRACGGQECRP